VNIINNDTRNPGVRASLIQSGGGYVFQMQGQDTGAANSLNINFSATPPDKFTDLPGFDTLATWYDRPSQDAEFYLDGNENQRFYSASNSLTEVIPGLTITLTDVTDEVSPSTLPGSPGSPLTVVAAHSVMLTVTNDAASAKARAREFVDSLNELLTKFQDLTKYDSSKSTTDRTQSSSQYDAQKGSVLTGNYGVQLLNSRLKSLAAATAKGFDPLELDGTGDVFWSLATIGIHLDADQNSQTFGRFVIDEGESDPESPFSTLDEALERDPQAVAELLAADKIVRGTSSDFSYVGMLRKDMVTAGEHSVRYSVSYDAVSNTNTVDYVFIDGVPASYDSTANEWTSTAKESAGMVIRVDNLGLGQHSGTLNVKQGKINELNELLQAEVAGANMEVGKQTDNKGSLLILKENYLKIIDNIDKKIEQEETRLLLWETRMRMQFARLDTLLAQYQQQMTANAASLAQANNSSSSS
jgi:flagellar hook-associated protein 2